MNAERNIGTEGETPTELRGIEASLNDLADAERASAPQTLEQDVFAASRAALADAPVVIARIGPRRTMHLRLALAAAVVIVGAAGAIWLKPVIPTTATPPVDPIAVKPNDAEKLEDEVNYLFALRSADDSLTTVGEKIDSLFLDASTLSDSVKADPASALLNDGAS
jgi:hypothetical protein